MNFLSDSEWLLIIDTIGRINSIDDHREFRRAILENLRLLIPYDSAAFFLTDRSKVEGNMSSFLDDPVGVDAKSEKLTEYMDSVWEDDELRATYSLTQSAVIRESDVLESGTRSERYFKDYLDELYVLTGNFACDKGPLGSLNLNREKEHGDFSDKEVQILRIVEPHVTNRLQRHRLSGSSESPFADEFYERYHITAREREIVYCVMQGMTNDAISNALCISPGTTKKHLENIFKKTGVGSRLSLSALLTSSMRFS